MDREIENRLDSNQNDGNSVVAEAIRASISNYLANNPNLSLRAIAARDEDLSREYIRKLAKSEISDNKLNKDKVLKLLQLISKKRKLTEVINHFDETISSYLKECYQVNFDHEVELTTEAIEKTLNESEELCVAYHLAHSDAGVSLRKAHEIMGARGESALSTLEKRNLVTQERGIFKASSKSFFHTTIETAHKIAQTFMRYYRPNHFGKKRNYIVTVSGSLNQMGVEAEQEIFRKFHKDLLELYEKDKYQGDIPCFATAAMDSFTVLKDQDENLH